MFVSDCFHDHENGEQVAELLTKRAQRQVVAMVSLVLKMLSFRLGTLVLCWGSCLASTWPFILNFSEMPVESRERVLMNWSRQKFLVPLRVVFVMIKLYCLFIFYTRVRLHCCRVLYFFILFSEVRTKLFKCLTTFALHHFVNRSNCKCKENR